MATYSGTAGNDTFTGGSSADTISGAGGDDTLDGAGGADTINGGAGNDLITGGSGNDTVSGGSGNDTFVVDATTDVVTELTGEGTDLVRSSVTFTLGNFVDNLTLTGSSAINATGNGDANLITGNTGANLINGGAGNDTMVGGSGNDTYTVDSASDVVTELAAGGTDVINASVSYTIAANAETLNLTGSGNINATGDAVANILNGNTGANLIDGGAGNDTMAGGAGNDTYVVDSTSDSITELTGGGSDLVQSSATFTLGSFVDNLTLTGSGNINATGNGDANTLTGNSGDNLIDGGAGNDTMVGGAGNDTYVVDSTSDSITELTGGGSDLVQSSATFTLGSFVDNLTLTGSGNINATGNSDANTITGNSGANLIDGGAGIDTMAGGSGNDTYVVDSVSDSITELTGGGTDLVQSSVSWTLGSFVDNLTLTGSSANNATGNGDANTITGNSGDNLIDGGAGNDTMIGGAGNDTYVVDSTSDSITELTGGGSDLVQSSATFTLGSFVDNLTLTGSGNINATGNSDANTIIGNSGANSISGGAGIDTMSGGAGDDTYTVDSTSDSVTELTGEGTDLVQSSVTWTLGNFVDNLTLTGTSAINATGNADSNTLTGNTVANRLDGGAGADSMAGGTGNDTYVVDNGSDSVVEGASAGTDTVESSITYALGSNLENLTLSGSNDVDGTGNTSDNTITGNSGVNTLISGSGNDTLTGGTGNDALQGDGGNDTYVFNAGDGTDTVSDSSGTDIIQLGAGITAGMITYARNGNDLTISFGSNLITVTNHFVTATQIETLKFADLSTVSLTSGLTLSTLGTTGADTLTGLTGDDTISGLAGDDTIDGGAGNDTILAGDDNDTVTGGIGDDNVDGGSGNDVMLVGATDGSDTFAGGDGSDTVRLAAGITAGMVTMQRSGNDLILFLSTGNQITLANHFVSPTVETLQYGDLTTKSLLGTLDLTYVGTSAANTLSGGDGNDTLDANGGADTLNGNLGNDWLYGDDGNDTYVVDNGEGSDNIYDASGTDVLQLSAGLLRADVQFSRIDNDLIVTLGSGDRITINDHYATAAVETLRFNDGTAIDLTGSLPLSTLGTVGNDTLTGTEVADDLEGLAGNDTISGLGGNDILRGGLGDDSILGGLGNDTFHMHAGDGNDIIADTAGRDSVVLASDIARADVKISRDGSSLIIEINDDQRITYQNQFLNLVTTDQRLDYVKFADGTNVWVGGFVGRYQVATAGNDLRLGSAAWDSMWGLGGNDILQGFAGDDEMWGGLGDDIVTGGVGNDKVYGDVGKDRLYGGLGNDIAFGGDGDDKIWGNEGNDTIYGGAGNDIISAYLGDDLIYGDAGNDSIDGSYGIDTLDYSAATVAIFANLYTKVITGMGYDTVSGVENLTGTSFNDSMVGSILANKLNGGAGDDLFRGQAGIDTLTGGAGNDTFNWLKFDVLSPTNVHLGVDLITDFTTGDKLDLRAMLVNQTYANINAAVQVTDLADGLLIAVKNGSGWTNIATLVGLHSLSVNDLDALGAFVIS